MGRHRANRLGMGKVALTLVLCFFRRADLLNRLCKIFVLDRFRASDRKVRQSRRKENPYRLSLIANVTAFVTTSRNSAH